MKKLLFAAASLLASCICMFAQTTNATLGGTVSDTSGALIPGVTVTATNTQTGIVATVLTNESGAYQFASLQTGTYNVSAGLSGFRTQTHTDVLLGVFQQVRLNFSLQVASVTTAVEVIAATDTLIATTSASIGAVLPEYKVRDLPLGTRNVLDLVATTAGTQGGNFAGSRITQLNTTRDGIPVSDGRYDNGAATSTYVSPDLVEEVRIVVAPADAEMGRGSGQVQMATRSGTNQFHGSVFWANRNSKLNANTWLNNFNGVGKDYSNGNQYGGRLAGPIVENKTFFFFLFEGQRFLQKSYTTGTVLTGPARQGNFRYFQGVQNGNVLANTTGGANPTVAVVDRLGSPRSQADLQAAIQAAGSSVIVGPLTTVSVFNRDPNRPTMDSSGWVQRLIDRMPEPNDYAVGDGLNTAGIRWVRRVEGMDLPNGDGQDTNRDQYNFRIDHVVTPNHKATFSGTWERDWAETAQAGLAGWPGGYNGSVSRKPRVFSGSLVSTLSPTVVNEFRFGSRKNWNYSWSSVFRPDSVGEAARKGLPVSNGIPFYPTQILFGTNIYSSIFGAGASRGQTSPLWAYNDTLSWTKGKHAFKTGAEVRFTSSRGFNGTENPEWAEFNNVTIGAGGVSVPATAISNNPAFPRLVGNNITTAQNLLLDLTGAVSNVSLTYAIHTPTETVFTPPARIKDYHQNEWGAFFKDDWKILPNLTLNLGIRYDYYGVPWESNGMHALPVGGAAGLFGLSGKSFADMWQPGHLAGSPTQLQLVGKNSNHPDEQFYKDDWNNFAPAVGFSWSLPWFGKDKTVMRAGYGVNYHGAASYNAGLNIASGNNPGLTYIQNFTTLGLGNVAYNLTSLPVPLPAPTAKPLDIEGLNAGISPLIGFDDNRVNPYIQNWNLEVQRELAKNLTLEARYIGSKGTKLYGGISLNDVNIFENKFLEAFNLTRAGGDAPMFDQMLRGLVMNTTQGAVNGTTVFGSAALRLNTASRAFIANGQVGQLANFLNTSNTVTGQGRGLLRNSGSFPENFFVVNPQYLAVVLQSNPGNSTYHAMEFQVTKRLSQGFTSQFAYTWSRSLSDASTDGNLAYKNPRDRSANKSLTSFHRTQDIRSNGTFELPIGPNRPFLNGGPAFVQRLTERWQLGAIFSWTTGAPLTISASGSTFSFAQSPGQTAIASTANTPVLVGDFPKNLGKITPTNNGAYYFAGYTQTSDPGCSEVTLQQSLNTLCTNAAIRDAQGNIVLRNPSPGQLGTLGARWIQGPSHIGLDVNLIKRIRIAESKQFEIRMDVVNVLNTPYWNDPTTDINSPNFGRMTAGDVTGAANADVRTGNRRFTLNARINF